MEFYDFCFYEDRQIILYGQSIGTVPTIDLASSPIGQNVAAVILHSPLLSGIRVIVPNAKKTSNCFDPFPSIDKVGKISANVQGIQIQIFEADFFYKKTH